MSPVVKAILVSICAMIFAACLASLAGDTHALNGKSHLEDIHYG